MCVVSGHILHSILKCHCMDAHHIPHLSFGGSPLLATPQKPPSHNLMMWKIHLNAQNNPLSNWQQTHFGAPTLCHVVTMSNDALASPRMQSAAGWCLPGC